MKIKEGEAGARDTSLTPVKRESRRKSGRPPGSWQKVSTRPTDSFRAKAAHWRSHTRAGRTSSSTVNVLVG